MMIWLEHFTRFIVVTCTEVTRKATVKRNTLERALLLTLQLIPSQSVPILQGPICNNLNKLTRLKWVIIFSNLTLGLVHVLEGWSFRLHASTYWLVLA